MACNNSDPCPGNKVPMCSPPPPQTYKFTCNPTTTCKNNPCNNPAPICIPMPVCNPMPPCSNPCGPNPRVDPSSVPFEMLSQGRSIDNRCGGVRPVFLIPIGDLEKLQKGKLNKKSPDDELANTVIPPPLAFWDQKNWPLITHPEICPADNYNSYKKWKINQEVRDGKRHPRDLAPYFGQKTEDDEDDDEPVILRLPDIVCHCQMGPGCNAHEGKCAKVVPRFLIYIKGKKTAGDTMFADWRPGMRPDPNGFSRFIDFDWMSQW